MQEVRVNPEVLINENILYAKKLARRFFNKRAHSQAELQDLESAAFVGLCEAASRFSSSNKNKFQTFSYLRIVGSMYEYLIANGGYSRSDYKKLDSGKNSIQKKATLAIARDLEELKRIQALIEDWGIKLSINIRQGSVDISYSEEKSIDDSLLEKELHLYLRRALNELSPELRKIVKARYLQGKTLFEIVEMYPNYSRSYVSRACNAGLVSLRKKLNKYIMAS